MREKRVRYELDALQTGMQLLHQDYTQSQAYVHVVSVNSWTFWKTLSTCTGLGKRRQTTLAWPCSSPSISKLSANSINSFFISSVNSIVSVFQPAASNTVPLTAELLLSAPHVFTFKPVSELYAISSLKSPATTSRDKMSLRPLKLSMPIIANPLATIFNMSIAVCTFSSTWKLAQVIPILKKRNCHDIANYRLVSLLPLLSKVMEQTINQQLRMHLESSSLLHKSQHSFRKKRLCNSALLALTNRLLGAKNNKQTTAIAVLDFSRAFDRPQYIFTKTHQFYLQSSHGLNLIYQIDILCCTMAFHLMYFPQHTAVQKTQYCPQRYF